MKNKIKNIFKILVVTAGCLMFASFSPSLDGRAVVVDDGVFPQGLFAKTVGYLPGDIISVTNIAGDTTVDILVIGALDPSEGVAIMLSPEAAQAMGIEKGANNIVKITKRSGQDERVYGNAVISKSAAEIDDWDDESFANIADEENTEAFVEPEPEAAEEMAAEETPEEESAPVSDDAFDEEFTEEESVFEEPEVEEEFEEADFEEEFAEPEEETAEPAAEEEAEENFEEATAEETEEFEEVPAEEAIEEEAIEEETPSEEALETEEPLEEEAFEEENLEEEALEEAAAEEEAPVEEEFEEAEEAPEEEAFDADELGELPEEEPEEEEFVEEEPAEETFEEEDIPAEESEEEMPAEEAFLADELGELPGAFEPVEEPEETEEESEDAEDSEEYEAIVLVPVDSNPPESDSDEVEDLIAEDELEEIEEESLEAAPVEISESIAVVNTSPLVEAETKPEATSYDKYIVPSLKDLESGKYYIQIAVYGNDENILEVINKYGSNYPITIVPMAGGKTKQVLVGPVTMDEYKVVLERFKSYGFKDAFLRKVR